MDLSFNDQIKSYLMSIFTYILNAKVGWMIETLIQDLKDHVMLKDLESSQNLWVEIWSGFSVENPEEMMFILNSKMHAKRKIF